MRQGTPSNQPAFALRRRGSRGSRLSAARFWLCAPLALICLFGCASTNYVKLRPIPQNPLNEQLNLLARGGPKPTARTEQFLRRHDLLTEFQTDPKSLLAKIHATLQTDPSPDGCQAYAELAYIGGINQQSKNATAALDMFGASVAHSYLYLFDPRFSQFRNPYDPQYRQACDLYNESLESALRIVQKQNQLKPAMSASIQIGEQTWEISVEVKNGPWSADEIERFEFVSDYEVNGLQNHYHTYGLGVPLVAVRKPPVAPRATEKYHPPGLSFPVTAFLRLLPDESGSHAFQQPQAGATCKRHRAVLELYDPLTATDISVNERLVPLESDLSTPLAYFLNSPQLNKLDASTTGLFWPGETAKITGLYMLQPYQPNKVPVVFVHGLWSSPITWMEMFNDLQGNPQLRDRYQFLFYLYPTGQPFWYSATQLRADLQQFRETVDPGKQSPALDQMVLVGHSMGGLVSRLQVLESEDKFWQIVSEQPFENLKADKKTKADLRKLFFFEPNRSIARIVTIGTPHLGSEVSNDYTQWLGRKLISLPEMLTQRRLALAKDNPGLFRDPALLQISTSIDSLSPKSPIFPVMFQAHKAPWVKHHNIVGKVARNGIYSYAAPGDGVVEYSSGSLNAIKSRVEFAGYMQSYDIASEIEVPANHVDIHRHPKSVLEVQNILTEHARTMSLLPNPWLRQNRGMQTAEITSPNTAKLEPRAARAELQIPLNQGAAVTAPYSLPAAFLSNPLPPASPASALLPVAGTERLTDDAPREGVPLGPELPSPAPTRTIPPGMIPMADRPAAMPLYR